MMNFKTGAAILLLGLLGGVLGANLIAPKDILSRPKETALERVLRTGTLRCGYNDWQPFFKKEGVNGKPEGFLVDLMNALGEHANLKVEWTTFIDWGNAPADLGAGKADTFCAAIYANAARARGMLFGEVVGYQYLEVFVRADDNRFTGTPEEAFNRSDITIVGWEGTPTLMQAKVRFPKAKALSLSTNEGTSSAYISVATGKADVFFTSMADAQNYMKNNPGKLKRLDRKYNLGRQSITVNAAMGEHDLLNFLSTAMRELKNDGTFDRIYRDYNARVPGFMDLQ
ncbi:MAG: transporter substrate-binding domain-containing protein [Alphaproteobacteria bacterium]|nr:transporter substrate-binding domain-containing protein [Alphaproteobacteria bacterium]